MIRNSHLLKRGVQCVAILAAVGTGAMLAQSGEDLRLTQGKSVIIDYPTDFDQVATTNPEVLDTSAITKRQLLLNAKGLGSTTMIVWSKGGERTFYNVNVEMNLDPLRRILKDSFPKENIEPHSSRDTITLNGTVSSRDIADRAAALAGAQSKTVVNNLLVAGPMDKQILLRVRFAELDREKEVQFGVNLLAGPGGNPIGAGTGQFSSGSLSGSLTIPPTAAGTSTTNSGNTSTSAGSASSGGTTSSTIGNAAVYTIDQMLNIFALDPKLNLGVFIKALQNENILQILAEPNLVTSDRKEASFLVGGQFPVPVVQGGATAGAVTVQFKEYGIKLNFLPVITPNNTIKMHLRQEVSTLDLAHAVVLNGFTIPALASRLAESDVELGEGQSFVVAGLINNQETNQLSKVPVLGSLPILGALFKSKDDINLRQELIMVVTPEITMPLGPNDARPEIYMPKDFLKKLDPKDLQVPQKGKKK